MTTDQTSGGAKAAAPTEGGRRPAKAAPKAAARGARSRPAATGGRTGGRTGDRTKGATKADAGRSVTVPLTGVRVPMVGVRVPGADMVTESTRRAAETVRSYLPPVERMVYYGGLGTAALVGVLEWPVAVAAGVGVWVASRARRPVDRAASQ